MIATEARSTQQDTDQGATTAPAEYLATTTETARSAESRPTLAHSRAWRGFSHIGVITAALTLFIGVSAFAGTVCQLVLADRAAAAARLEVARAAAAVITTLWTYTPDTVGTLSERAGDYLDGEFCSQYRQLLQAAIVRARQARVSDKTEVVGIAVEALHRSNATALVFTNTTVTTPYTHNAPSLKHAAYRLAMTKPGPRWLVTAITTISFVDVTPEIEPEPGGAGGQ